MWFDPFWSYLEQAVFPIPSMLEGDKPLFNLYNAINPQFDLPQATAIRRANLFSFLDSLPERPPVLLLGEAPGWHGCRFSGVSFTSEAQFSSDSLPFQGHISSHTGAPHAEASATIFWQALKSHHPHFFVWSSVPFHPHQPGEPLSNRTPSQPGAASLSTGALRSNPAALPQTGAGSRASGAASSEMAGYPGAGSTPSIAWRRT